MAELIFERAVHRNPESGELESYWPENWPLITLAEECIAVGTPFFSASYQNDASALEGNKLMVAWLQPYTESELVAARLAANVDRGMVYAGLDFAAGGQGTDPDMMGLFAIEVLGTQGFAISALATRKKVEEQATFAEQWLDVVRPNAVVLEDTSAAGFAGNSMRMQINGGNGTKWPLTIEKPQGARDKGGKERRLMAIAARWESGQIRLPGAMAGNNLIIDSRFDLFVQQWRSFPVGHDDILDAAYWACYNAFADVVAGAAVIGPEGFTNQALRTAQENGLFLPATDSHGREVRPIGQPRQRNSVRWSKGRGGR